MQLHNQQLADIALGADILGSGGGGSARFFIRDANTHLSSLHVDLLAVEALPQDALVLPIGMAGSNSVFVEHVPKGTEILVAIEQMTSLTGDSVQALITTEIGGANAGIAMLAASASGLPLVDADLQGRSFPFIDQLSTAVVGVPLTPCCIVSPDGSVTTLTRVHDAYRLEQKIRAIIAHSGGYGFIAYAPIPVHALRSSAIHRSFGRALELGVRLRGRGDSDRTDCLSGIKHRWVGVARIEEIRATTQSINGYWNYAVTAVQHANDDIIRLDAQSEFVSLSLNGTVLATSPEVITCISYREGVPVRLDELAVGQEVEIIVLPSPWWTLRTSRLRHVLPERFGIPLPFVSSFDEQAS